MGAFAHSTARILKEDQAHVITYLTRDYGHFPPTLASATYGVDHFPNPCPLLKRRRSRVDLIVPMSIDWAQAPWKTDLYPSTGE